MKKRTKSKVPIAIGKRVKNKDFLSFSEAVFVLFPIAIGTLFFAVSVQAKVLPHKNQNLLNNYLLEQMHEQYFERSNRLNALANRADAERYVAEKRVAYAELFGAMPERTPLRAQTTGRLAGEGFVIEKVIYESFPRHRVTANLYLPRNQKGKRPAVLFLCGHGDAAKAEPEYQLQAQLLARCGFVVLVVDPISQGERMQLTDRQGRPLERGGTTEHTLLNAGSLLVGESTAKYELWDNIRSLDYLLSRSEADSERVAAIGSSGGATQTMFLLAAEPRLRAGIVCSIFSQHERNLELEGASDGCRHLPFEGARGLEIADQIAAFAPRPVLLMAGKRDFIDYEGVKRGFRELRRIYSLLGEEDGVQLLTTDGGHGISREKRERAVEFLLKHLCNTSTLISDDNRKVYTREELNCTKSGQVNAEFADEQTVADRNLALAESFAPQRERFAQKNNRAAQARKIRELLGIDYRGNIAPELVERTREGNHTLEKWIVHAEGELPLPCELYVPDRLDGAKPIVLGTSDRGKDSIRTTERFGQWLAEGQAVLLFDMRGMGETADAPERNDRKFRNAEYANALLALHIGKPLLGQRVVDVMMAIDLIAALPVGEGLRALPVGYGSSAGHGLHTVPIAIGSYRYRANKAEPVVSERSRTVGVEGKSLTFYAEGACVMAGVHAAFLTEVEHFQLLPEPEPAVPDWARLLRQPALRDQFTCVVPNVLRYYDVGDLTRQLKK